MSTGVVSFGSRGVTNASSTTNVPVGTFNESEELVKADGVNAR